MDEQDEDAEQETPADDAEITRQQVEALLSKCESNPPQVYVMEMMSMLPSTARRKNATATFKAQYMVSPRAVLSLVKLVAHEVWAAPRVVDNGILYQDLALISDCGTLESLWLGCECIWLREVVEHEVFETKDRWLLLQPHKVREIVSDFVLEALQTRLAENHGDARLAVLHAAGELLLENLGEDIGLIPDRFSEVVEAIDEVLAAKAWFTMTKEDILSLSEEVIRRVGRQ